MDISKSLDICLKKTDMQKQELAVKLGTTRQSVSTLAKSKHCSPAMLDKLCEVFDMKASEFIALGE